MPEPCVESGRAQVVRAVLDNEPGPARDIVLLNAGAALYAADLTDSIATGVDMARNSLASGQALQRVEMLAELSQKLAP